MTFRQFLENAAAMAAVAAFTGAALWWADLAGLAVAAWRISQ
ncbi:hypothetical protein HDIA_2231 [Hartmannibacter diazotrophicus]|uniref:Uncharacterized protein n=1 Tax=Hartmannibacter diazotrophicus TaxID=1482074 RepID=A0A2C9D613_9HYPH|nr:hypothetical protein [Hartmannibacter diazotrophicus]SON55772.1 hypothetical protein HDIA_2231 [Hartmannibacter diazotrophicus]